MIKSSVFTFIFQLAQICEANAKIFQLFAFSSICNEVYLLEHLWKDVQFSKIINVNVFTGQHISGINVNFQVIHLCVKMGWMDVHN